MARIGSSVEGIRRLDHSSPYKQMLNFAVAVGQPQLIYDLLRFSLPSFGFLGGDLGSYAGGQVGDDDDDDVAWGREPLTVATRESGIPTSPISCLLS